MASLGMKIALLALVVAMAFATTTKPCDAACKAAEAAKKAKEEKKEQEEHTDAMAATVLLGTVAFAMGLFYLINSAWSGVSEQTWNMISTSISIFVGVMMYQAGNKFCRIILGMGEAPETEGVVEMSEFWRHLGVMLVWWCVVMTLIYCNRNCKLRLVAYGTIAGHIMGFAAIGAYEDLAHTEAFQSPWASFFGTLFIYLISIPVVLMPVRCFFKCAEKAVGEDKNAVDRVHDQAKDTATDFFCMGASFIISMGIRSVIIGKVAQGEAAEDVEEKARPSGQVGVLFGTGVVFLILAGSIKVCGRCLTKKKGSEIMAEICEIVTTTTALTSAWCLLNAAFWHVMPQYTCKVVGHLVVAMIFSIIFAIAVHFISCLGDVGDLTRAFRGEMTALGLALGLSWEGTFDACLESASELVEEEMRQKFTFAVTFVLLLVVFPAWVAYILPKHDSELKEEYKGVKLHPWVACGDCCPEGDDDEDYDEVDEEG